MATVEVAVQDLERRSLPPVCVKTGLPAEVVVAKTYAWVPDWTWILILFGIFPFLIARHFAAHRVTLELPATVEVDRIRRNPDRTTILICVVAIALLTRVHPRFVDACHRDFSGV
jgi:hypothetical protein